jgi:hypothetical protein
MTYGNTDTRCEIRRAEHQKISDRIGAFERSYFWQTKRNYGRLHIPQWAQRVGGSFYNTTSFASAVRTTQHFFPRIPSPGDKIVPLWSVRGSQSLQFSQARYYTEKEYSEDSVALRRVLTTTPQGLHGVTHQHACEINPPSTPFPASRLPATRIWSGYTN